MKLQKNDPNLQCKPNGVGEFSGIASELLVDPERSGYRGVVADQLGHTLDVNQNVYTRVGFDRQEDAIKRLDSALRVS